MLLNIQPATLSSSSFCKNHPEIPSGYFLGDHPDTKFCKNCALNAALCGRKIQKVLTEAQLQRKGKIQKITDDLVICLEENQLSQHLYRKLEDYLQEVSIPLQMRMREIDSLICQLSNLRQKMSQTYRIELAGEMERCNKMRGDSSINEIHIKKVIEHIECNFTNLIELDDPAQFQSEFQEWRKILEENRERIMDKFSFQEKRTFVKEHLEAFMNLYQKATEVRIQRIVFWPGELNLEENKENDHLWSTDINLEGSRLVEELKINLTANAQLQTRNKKQMTDRERQSFTKKTTRRQSTQINEQGIESTHQVKKNRR